MGCTEHKRPTICHPCGREGDGVGRDEGKMGRTRASTGVSGTMEAERGTPSMGRPFDEAEEDRRHLARLQICASVEEDRTGRATLDSSN